MRVGALLVGLSLVAAPAAAADGPICADRPGKSTPTCTVAAGHWQVETGLVDWSLQKAGSVRETSLVIAETTLRYGLTGRSEIEVDFAPWQHATVRTSGFRDRASGAGDLALLYKHRVTSGEGPVQLAVMPAVTIPVAGHALGNGKVEAALMFPIDVAIGQSPLSLNLTPEADWTADGDGHGHHAAFVQVASLGWQANARLNVSAALWRQWDDDPAGTVRQASADATAAYLINSNVQIDAGASFGLDRNTPDLELSAGVSTRF